MLLFALYSLAALIAPPIAQRVPHAVRFGKVSGEDRGANPMDPPIEMNDDFFWIRDDSRASSAVLGLLRSENSYTQARTAGLDLSRYALYQEILSHVEEDADEYPLPRADGFEYFSRTAHDAAFKTYLRRKCGGATDDLDVVLDVNAVAESLPLSEQRQCAVSEVKPSPTGRWLAYTLDTSGYETYDIHLRELGGRCKDGVDESLTKTGGGISWLDDSTFIYISQDASHRPFQLWRHRIHTPQSTDALVFEETDPRFIVRCSRARDGSILFLISESKETTEVHYIPCSAPDSRPTLVRAREPGVRYEVDSHAPSRSLLITSNVGDAVNRQLLIASLDSPSSWTPLCGPDGQRVFGHSGTRSIESAFAFDRFIAVNGRQDGFTRVWTVQLVHGDSNEGAAGCVRAAGSCRRLHFPEEACTAEVWAVDNELFAPGGRLRVEYESMTSPRALLEFDVVDSAEGSQARTLHVQPVPNYDASLYSTCRLEVLSRDGETTVPLTLLWRQHTDQSAYDHAKSGEQQPLPSNCSVHLYAYGSYGASIDPHFSGPRLSLVDRGIIYAIAHVRGGGEKGQHAWYESDGKYLSKRHTFEDFVDCAHSLVDRGIARPGAITIEGRSAGGLLVGAVVNMAPRLFRAALAAVPFVDTMVSMCDPSIPLTTEEWEEWGNPNEAKYYKYMLSYSPIHNVQPGATYPAMLIVAGLYDPRVAYWEPTKWAQVLRATVANGEDVLLQMDLAAGHYSASDRYARLRQLAFEYAWLLDQHSGS